MYPGADEPAKTRKQVRQILEAGITYFVDLTAAHQLKPYAFLLQEDATLLGLSAKHQPGCGLRSSRLDGGATADDTQLACRGVTTGVD